MNLDLSTNVEKKIIFHRDERMEIGDNIHSKIELTFDSKKITGKILNVSRFGARFKLEENEKSIPTEVDLLNISLEILEKKFFDGKGKIINIYPSSESNHYGILFYNNGVDTGKIKTFIQANSSDKKLFYSKTLLSNISQVKADFKILTSEFHVILQKIRDFLLQKEKLISSSMTNPEDIVTAHEYYLDFSMKEYAEIMNAYCSNMTKLVKSYTPEEEKISQEYFMATVHPIVLGAGFISHGFTKPLGYAGDYKLMTMLYDYEDLGNNLFEKFFHRWSCNVPAAIANKNRVHLLSKILCEESLSSQYKDSFKVSSVACGSAREIELFLENREQKNNQKIMINCIDLEKKAIEYASNKLKIHSSNNIQINFLAQEAVMGIIKKSPFTTLIDKSNCIISAGLFDYLNDRVSTKLIRELFYKLEINGLLIIGNVADPNPDFFSMNYLMDWKLFERSKQDLLNLMQGTNIPNECYTAKVISEEIDLNLFLIIKKIRNL